MNIKKSILIRVRIAFLMATILVVAIVVKITHIQYGEGDRWRALGQESSFQIKKVKATRGNIYSDNGSLLATSLPFYIVAIDPVIADERTFQQNIDSLGLLLSRHFKDKSKDAYIRMIKDARTQGKRYCRLNKKQINYLEKKEMADWPIFREGRYKGGIIFEKVDKRFRPFNNLALRTVGFVNENYQGAGLEYSFNNYLAGRDGEALYQKISGGSWKPVFDGTEIKPENGLDIETTLDVNVQDVTETALLRALERHQADYGTAIVMEVSTGKIKGMANLSRTKAGFYAERYNYAVGREGLQEPGSTFKLATMMALLEKTGVSIKDSIDTGTGSFSFYNHKVRDHHEGGLGRITVREAFEQSSNIAMARLVDLHFGHEPERFLKHLEFLGLTRPLDFQMIGAGIPRIKYPKDKDWSGITLPWMAYGYGLEMTPLQILTLYNAVANNGKMVKPMVVKSIRHADRVKQSFKTEVINPNICSKENLGYIRDMLEGVVQRGTAQNIKGADYKIAGKTGTAQILENGQYTRKYITSFAGYFPAHKPKYSAIIVIKNPKGWEQYGSNVAAPVFKEIADNIYARDQELHEPIERSFIAEYGIFPVIRGGHVNDMKLICNELGISNHLKTEEEWVTSERSGNAVVWKDRKNDHGLVPDVMGLTLRDAIYLLEKNGLKVQYEGKGRVREQSQMPGSRIVNGQRILIKLS